MTSDLQLTPPPGYGPVTALDKQRHAGLGLREARSYAWCAGLNAVYVSVTEFGRAALDYPIAFAREPAGLVPLAVLGLEHRNLFVDAQGAWLERAYVPGYLRRHPFCTADVKSAAGREAKRLVCVQEDALAPTTRPLFDAQGAPTAEWEPIAKLLESLEGARPQTEALLRRLEALELLAPFDAIALPRSGPQLRLQGLLRVDEPKLAQLNAGVLRELIGDGGLRAIYAHLVSLENFARLLDLQQAREQHGH